MVQALLPFFSARLLSELLELQRFRVHKTNGPGLLSISSAISKVQIFSWTFDQNAVNDQSQSWMSIWAKTKVKEFDSKTFCSKERFAILIVLNSYPFFAHSLPSLRMVQKEKRKCLPSHHCIGWGGGSLVTRMQFCLRPHPIHLQSWKMSRILQIYPCKKVAKCGKIGWF